MRKKDCQNHRVGIAFKVLIICVVIVSVLAITSCEESKHNCLFGGQELTAGNVSALESSISNLQRGVHFYYLKSSYTLDKPLKVPEGTFVGICGAGSYRLNLNGDIKLFEVVDRDPVGSAGHGTIDPGGVYFYNCGTHGIHGGKTYYRAEQSMLDLFADSGINLYSRFAVNNELCLALTSDVTIDDECFVIPNGYTLRICLNSLEGSNEHNLTIKDGLDLTRNGGELIIINCLSPTYHECIYLDNDRVLPIDGKSSVSINQALAKISALESGEVLNAYLVNDLEWQEELFVKEGVTVMVCLNGFDATGPVKTGKVTEEVIDPVSGVSSQVTHNYGNILFYDCSNHLCQDINDTGRMLAIREGTLDWTISTLKQMYTPSSSLTSVWFVLEEDVNVPVVEGFDFHVCLNGFKSREPVNEIKAADGTVSGRVTYYNCASSENSVYHSCELIKLISQGTMHCNPLEVSTVDELNQVFSNFTAETPYLLYLTSDIVGSGVVTAPAGTMVTICKNGYNMDGVTFDTSSGQLMFAYECSSKYCDLMGEHVTALDQNIIDFMEMISSLTSVYITSDTTLAVTENVNIPSGIFVVSEGCTLTICTHGYNVTGIESGSSIVLHDGCQNCTDNDTDTDHNVPPLVRPHASSCFIPSLFGIQSTKLEASNLDQANSILGSVTEEQGIAFYHLTSDIVGSGVLKATDNTVAGICLNGYTISDSITLADGVLIYECKEQYCAELDETLFSLDQGIFDFFTALYNRSGENTDEPMFVVDNDFKIALSEDVTIPDNLFSIGQNGTLQICSCGHNVVCGGVLESNDKVYIHSGCVEGRLQCSVCDRNNAQPFNYYTYSQMIDNTGRVILPPGSYYYYLENDFQLTRTITIPDGVDLHICTHGYDLYSAYIWSDSKTYGGGYPESTSTGIAMVEPGGVWNIYDCSETMSSELSIKFFRKDQNGDGIRELLMTVSDDNTGFEGLGEGIGALLAVYVSNVATNAGTINIYGGNFNSMIGFINTGNGVINIYRGNVNSAAVGVLQAPVNESSDSLNPSVYIGEGATMSAGLAGVYGMAGDVTLDGGTINAGVIGISLTSDNPDSNVTLNGGNINVADSSQMLDTIMGTWSTVGGNTADFNMNLDSLQDMTGGITAVTTNKNVTMNGDVNITTGDMTSQLEEPYADVNVAEDSNITVSEQVSGNYTLNVEGTTTVGTNDVFTPSEGCMKLINSEGEIVIMPVPSGGVYAKVHAMSVSTKGEVTLNLYAKVLPELKDRIMFCVEYLNCAEPVIYSINDAEAVTVDGVEMYCFSLSVAAKDYASGITYYFVLKPVEEGMNDNYADFVGAKMATNSVSVKDYLDKLADSSDRYGSKAAELALAMKNYCEAVAKHFGVSDSYEAPEGFDGAMDSVTVDSVKDYAPTREGDYANSVAIFKTASVMLESKTSIRIYFALAEGYSLEDVDISVLYDTVGISASDIDVTVGETGYKSRPYYVEVSGIYAKDLNKTFSITIDTWTVNYSVMSYVQTVLKNTGAFTEDLVNAVKSLFVYNEKAIAYFVCEHYYDNACDDRCNGCGVIRTVNTHVESEPVIENYVASTTCKDGSYQEVVYCAECNYRISTLYRTISAEHVPAEPVQENRVESTCMLQGHYYSVVYCSSCNYLISSEVVYLPLASHTWGEADSDNRVTCTVCSAICSADGHTVVTDDAVAPTCTSTGLTEGKHCSECNEIIVAQTVIAAKGHTPGDANTVNQIEPTCSADGGYDTVVSCAVCGYELSREHTVLPATAHTPGTAVTENNVNPTCTSAGGYDKVVYCEVCDFEISRDTVVTGAALGHDSGYVVIENSVESSCASNATYETATYCTVCNEEISRTTTVIPTLKNHVAAEEPVIENDNRTCTDGGSYDSVVYCKECGEELSRDTYYTDAIGHFYENGTCIYCGESETNEGEAE